MRFNPKELSDAARDDLEQSQLEFKVMVDDLSLKSLRSLVLQLGHYQLANDILGKEVDSPTVEEQQALEKLLKLQESVMGSLQLEMEQGE